MMMGVLLCGVSGPDAAVARVVVNMSLPGKDDMEDGEPNQNPTRYPLKGRIK